MAGVDIDKLEAREEAADQGNDLVRHVLALGAADEEGGPLEARRLRVRKRETTHLVEVAAKDAQGHAEFLLGFAGLGAVKVSQEELADGKFLQISFISLLGGGGGGGGVVGFFLCKKTKL